MRNRNKKTPDPPNRCPACGGWIRLGGVRFGYYTKDIWNCMKCGLTSESFSYYDAIKQIRVDMPICRGSSTEDEQSRDKRKDGGPSPSPGSRKPRREG